MNIIDLAKKCGIVIDSNGWLTNDSGTYELEAFATAIIENYKAESQPEPEPESVVLDNRTAQKPLSHEQILIIASEYAYAGILYARAIEKAHGIGE